LAELIKFIVSLVIYIKEESEKGEFSWHKLGTDCFGPESEWWKLTIPAGLYFVQNNLQYVAVTLLDAATFQVTYQFKIITTAMFTVLLLHRSLTNLKWVSLGLLTAGIALVQMPTGGGTTDEHAASEKFFGLLAVVVACLLSGLAGVYFEKILKGSKASLWVRNIQLSLFSFVPGYIFGVLLKDGQAVRRDGFFYGYSSWAYAAILCQALGGLIVAMVVKYAGTSTF
jgi:UDP-sugar transporter A1/2/3